MNQFDRLGHELARAALYADLEYIRWSGTGIYDAGCESMLSTAAARTASAFYGVAGDVRVHLEYPVNLILGSISQSREAEIKEAVSRQNGRIDCYVEKAGRPFVLIECKRYLQATNIEIDLKRLLSLKQSMGQEGAIMIVGARRQREGAKDRETLVRKDAEALQQHFGQSIRPILYRQELDDSLPIGNTRGGKGKWTHSVGVCLVVAPA
jgi:hypothetical protein